MTDGDPLAIGVDVGSTHVKAVVADTTGTVHSVARAPTPSRADGDVGTIHPVDDLLATVESVVREVVATVDAAAIDAVGIASVAEAGAPVDDLGRPLADIIAWFDPRPASAAKRLAEAVEPSDLFARTGLRPEAKVTLAKLGWLRDADPTLVGRMAGWRFVADLVAGAWTGAAGTSVTLACRSMAWDLRRHAWDRELLALVGVRLDQVPPVLPWTEAVGRLGPSAGRRLGLRPGLRVAVAGHDHVVGALAAGVTEPGDVLDSIGTAEALLLVTPEPALADVVRAGGFSVGAHVMPGRFTTIAGIQTSGAFVDWFLSAFTTASEAGDTPGDRYAALDDLVRRARCRPSGIVARPTLRGRTAPLPDSAARASFEGLSVADGLPELALSALEGTAYHARWLADELERVSGVEIARIRAIGGGTQNEALLAVKAALARAPLEVVESTEAVAVGAALVGAVAAGLTAPEALLSRDIRVHEVSADTDLACAYDEIYRTRFLRSPTAPAGDVR